MLSVPSVTMNGGSFSRVTSRPLRSPVARPTTQAEQQARARPGTWFVDAVCAITSPARVVAAPTERSMPRGEDDQRLGDADGSDHGDLLGDQRQVAGVEEPRVDHAEDDDRDDQHDRRAERRVAVQQAPECG